MRPEGHPVYPPSKVTCACGNVMETRSTRGSFSVEICSNCHPFYTGKYKLMDTAGRVERFRKKYEGKAAATTSEKTAALAEEATAKKAATEAKVAADKAAAEKAAAAKAAAKAAKKTPEAKA